MRRRHARRCRPAGVEGHITHERIASEPGRSHAWPQAMCRPGPHREGEEPQPMMHGREKSDRRVVPRRPANNAERSATEGAEGRRLLKGSANRHSTRRTQCRTSCVTSAALAAWRNWTGHPDPKAAMFTPKRGARCGKAARRDLCGGRQVIAVPTATAPGNSGSPAADEPSPQADALASGAGAGEPDRTPGSEGIRPRPAGVASRRGGIRRDQSHADERARPVARLRPTQGLGLRPSPASPRPVAPARARGRARR